MKSKLTELVQAPSGIITSTGEIGKVESRTFGRVYLSDETLYHTESEFFNRWQRIEQEANFIADKAENRRRIVFRTFVTADVLGSIMRKIKSDSSTNLDMVLPISEVDSKNGSGVYLIILAKNNHKNNMSRIERGRLRALEKQSTPRGRNGVEFYNKVKALSGGYSLTYSLNETDYDALLALWGHNFEWTKSGIEVLNKNISSGDGSNMWFCGVRNPQGELIAACMAESVWFRDRWFVELTEWAATYRGVSSKMVIALIAKVLDALHYGAGSVNNGIPFIVAEMNLFNEDPNNLGSPGAGISAGLRIPGKNERNISVHYNILRHNVAVGDGRHDKGFANINNFALGSLSKNMVDANFSRSNVSNIVAHVDESER